MDSTSLESVLRIRQLDFPRVATIDGELVDADLVRELERICQVGELEGEPPPSCRKRNAFLSFFIDGFALAGVAIHVNENCISTKQSNAPAAAVNGSPLKVLADLLRVKIETIGQRTKMARFNSVDTLLSAHIMRDVGLQDWRSNNRSP